MNYEDALAKWGKEKLREHYRGELTAIDEEQVTVDFNYTEGYACCGGRDPDCYCSLAESPSAEVEIRAGRYYMTIPVDLFDFSTILREIIAAGGGSITE